MRIEVYNAAGYVVATPVEAALKTGNRVVWDSAERWPKRALVRKGKQALDRLSQSGSRICSERICAGERSSRIYGQRFGGFGEQSAGRGTVSNL